MEALRIAHTEDTPEVILDAASGQFQLAKRSLPEDATKFYEPLIKWLQQYTISHQNKPIHFHFNLEYFNTASSKQILKLLFCLHEIAKTSEVKIFWYYDKEDKDMRGAGERYSKLVNLPFEFTEQ